MKRCHRLFKWVGIFLLTPLFIFGQKTEVVKATQTPALAPQSATSAASPEEALLTEADLPSFHTAGETEAVGYLALAKRITTGLLSPQTRIANISTFAKTDPFRPEYVITFLASPVSETDELAFDAFVRNPESILDSLRTTAQTSGNPINPRVLPGLAGLGDGSMGFSLAVGQPPVDVQVDFVWVRRAETVQGLWVIYPPGGAPSISLYEVASLVDQRVAERIVGTVFRPAGPLVPEITTYIPTPLDVSRRLPVILTNLFLAALMMLPFAVATETFTRLMGEKEEVFRDKFRLGRWILNLQGRLVNFLANGLKQGGKGATILRVALIILFYGLAFSLLDREWQPFSVTGLVLFLNMTVAYGLVGIADDIMQWRKLKQWGQPADLRLRPTNILIAAISTLTSRLLTLVPGLMFGTPEALVLDEARLGKRRRDVLLKISAYTLLGLGFGLWALTMVTTLLERMKIPAWLGNTIGGLEGFLLVVFAVALENTFVQMLGLPGSFGEALRKKSRWLWLLGLIGITFVFYHTLINPRGELVEAARETNVWIFLGISAAFVIFTFSLWAYVSAKGRKPRSSRPSSSGRSPTRRPGKLISSWVWLALGIIGIAVVSAVLVARNDEKLKASLLPTPAAVAAVSTPAPAPASESVNQGQAVFHAPAVLQKLCYSVSKDINRDVNDLYLWRGVQLASAEYGAGAVYSVPVTSDEAGYAGSLDKLVSDGCTLIVGDWSTQQKAFQRAAVEHPAQKFMLNGYAAGNRPDLPNLWVTEYSLHEGAYLAGYLAAAITKTGNIGTYGAIEDPIITASLNCFAVGAYDYSKAHSRGMKVLGWDPGKGTGLFANSFTSPDMGESISNDLIAQGADLLFPVGGLGEKSTSSGSVVAAGQHPGVSIIGNDLDWNWVVPEYSKLLFTSVEARYEKSIAIAADALVKGEFHGAKHQGSLGSGEIGFAPLNPSLGQVPVEFFDELVQQERSESFDFCGGIPQVWGFINNDAVGGWEWHAGAQLTIRAFASPGGPLLFTGTAVADQKKGEFFQGIQVDVVPGMVLEVTDGTDTVSATLDPLTVDVIDEKNDIVSGTTAAGADLYVWAGDSKTPGVSLWTTADANGRWQVDFAGQFDLNAKTVVQAMVPGERKNLTAIKIEPRDQSK